jgi:hypothetical protein
MLDLLEVAAICASMPDARAQGGGEPIKIGGISPRPAAGSRCDGVPIVNPAKPRIATTTAGLRATQWNADDLPVGVQLTVHPLTTSDGPSVTKYFFRRGGERSVVCAMHPRYS